jgi:hypothetical protein
MIGKEAVYAASFVYSYIFISLDPLKLVKEVKVR